MTPVEFMRILFECKPDIDEHMIISWQRASRDWTTDIFDFVWVVLQTTPRSSLNGCTTGAIYMAYVLRRLIDTNIALDDLMANMSV